MKKTFTAVAITLCSIGVAALCWAFFTTSTDSMLVGRALMGGYISAVLGIAAAGASQEVRRKKRVAVRVLRE